MATLMHHKKSMRALAKHLTEYVALLPICLCTHRLQSFVTLVVQRGSLFTVTNELGNMRSQHDSSDKYRSVVYEFHDDIDDLEGPDEKEKGQAISLFKGSSLQ
ncbi:hypothetical protein Tco_0903493 [Tanacetum coccineum]